MTIDPRHEQEEEAAAAAEAGAIGGISGDEGIPEAQRPLVESGEGESEGFELAEELLIEHASHGDDQSAHAILHHQGLSEEPDDRRADGEADEEANLDR